MFTNNCDLALDWLDRIQFRLTQQAEEPTSFCADWPADRNLADALDLVLKIQWAIATEAK